MYWASGESTFELASCVFVFQLNTDHFIIYNLIRMIQNGMAYTVYRIGSISIVTIIIIIMQNINNY
jgi:hypothetical protein